MTSQKVFGPIQAAFFWRAPALLSEENAKYELESRLGCFLSWSMLTGFLGRWESYITWYVKSPNWDAQASNYAPFLSFFFEFIMIRHDFSITPGESPQELTRRLRHLKPHNELRQEFEYTNIVRTHPLAPYHRPLVHVTILNISYITVNYCTLSIFLYLFKIAI